MSQALLRQAMEQSVREAFSYMFAHYGNDQRISASFAMLHDLFRANATLSALSCAVDAGEGPVAGRLTPHQLWRERAIWLLDALTDATRELRDNGELAAMLAHLDKHPSLAASPVAAPVDAREEPADFDRWTQNPYTKVLMDSIKNDYMSRSDAEALIRAASPVAADTQGDAKDAARYRWLREHTVATGLSRWMGSHQFLDAAIDAALNEQGKQP
jgi:hypothetical protein